MEERIDKGSYKSLTNSSKPPGNRRTVLFVSGSGCLGTVAGDKALTTNAGTQGLPLR